MNKTLVQEHFGKTATSYLTSAPHALGKSLERLIAVTSPHEDWTSRLMLLREQAMWLTHSPRMSRAYGQPILHRKCST